MANRSMSANLRDHVSQDQFHFAHLIHLVLEDSVGTIENLYFTDYWNDLDYPSPGSNTYLALGSLLEVGAVNEDSQLSVENLPIVLSGIDTSLLSSFVNTSYIMQDATVYFAGIVNGDIYDAPIIKYKGEQVKYLIRESGESATIEGTVANHFARFNRYSGFHTRVSEHSQHYPGDTFFAALDLIKEDNSAWGEYKGGWSDTRLRQY